MEATRSALDPSKHYNDDHADEDLSAQALRNIRQQRDGGEGGDVPDGWEKREDPQSGRTYYINATTKQSSWTLPGVE